FHPVTADQVSEARWIINKQSTAPIIWRGHSNWRGETIGHKLEVDGNVALRDFLGNWIIDLRAAANSTTASASIDGKRNSAGGSSRTVAVSRARSQCVGACRQIRG